MNNFDDLQQLWQQAAPVETPDAGEVIRQCKKQQRQMIAKGAGLSLLFLGTLVFIILIPIRVPFKLVSTTIGTILVVLAVAAALVVNTGLFAMLLRTSGNTADNVTYLNGLKRYEQRLRFMHTRGISIYFILLGTGMLLYMYEFLRHNVLTAAAGYALAVGWMLFVWIYIRPRSIKKQTAAITGMISRLENITGQMEE
ncbi:hypothetical protein [Deminuibacter soli]|uniref:Uncharacterized protein n=1 Tax=Deminuibacter soli TaxID=2291815 RepID=A0A3E1NQ82_9BACT|nr:hypothetical protein [Deminuibacter soli]RFM30109.1 hypothetical protein DXN05_03805 [Deminuibacter soli]